MKKAILILLLASQLPACINIDQYEKTVQIPAQKWFYNNTPSFTFTITDTSSQYNIYVVLRHTDEYNYSNIWLHLGTKFPGDTLRYQNINLKLANDAKGWDGTGMGDIFEVRKNISQGPFSFRKSGDYTFTAAQIMRENPLQHIMNIGIRVEKVKL
ncbi:MAG: gliding motility lipoprotein GldH [Ginsengibacter sp.]